MASTSGYNLSGGHHWHVGNEIVNEPCVIIPISQITDMEDAEIGQCVRDLKIEALRCRAHEVASDYYPGFYERASLDHLIKIASYLEPFAADDAVKNAYAAVQAEIQYRHTIPVIRAAIPKTRAALVQKHDQVFMQLGRRDGFMCTKCGCSKDLEIDHIMPVTRGGTNVLENLQLLCSACNRSKSNHVESEKA